MRQLGFLSAILILSCLVYSQTTPSRADSSTGAASRCAISDETAVREIAERWKDGYNRGDASSVADLYREDAYYLTQHFVTGILHGRPEIRAYVQRGIDAKYRIDSIETTYVECSGDFAYSIGHYDSTNAGQKAYGVNVVVLKKQGGRWLIVAHEAAVPDPATAIQRLDSPSGQ